MKKKLNQDELYRNMESFLKSKGIEIKDTVFWGKQLKTGCRLLTEGVNHAQSAIETARTTMEGQLEKMRDVVHRKTAPKTSRKSPGTPASGGAAKTDRGKKSSAGKTLAKKTAAKKTPAKKTAAKKTAAASSAKKTVVNQRPAQKKPASRSRAVAKKTAAKKTAARKSVAKKTAAKKTARSS